MVGNYFYNETIRKTVIAFGTLFNNISIKKYGTDGKSISQIKVPIAYGPIQRFIARIEQQPNFDDNVAISLPRLSFQLTSYVYDAARKASPVQKFTMLSPTSKTKVKKIDQKVKEVKKAKKTVQKKKETIKKAVKKTPKKKPNVKTAKAARTSLKARARKK
jgi:hypothetical protein